MSIEFDEKFKYECWSTISDAQHKLEKLWWRIKNSDEIDEQLLLLYENNTIDVIREMQYLSTKLNHKYQSLKDDKNELSSNDGERN